MRRIGIVLSAAPIGALWLACSAGSGIGSGGVVSGFTSCTTDFDCPADQGCQTDTPAGDAYCSPLCNGNAECPKKYECPSLVLETNGDCDDVGKHKGGRGACEQFSRSRGPKTCTSAAEGGTVVVTDAASRTD
jgi:hypothetical protein